MFLDEAFEEHPDNLCVPRHLAVLLHKSLSSVCESFDELLEGPEWRDQGICPQDIERWCVLRGHPYFLVRQGRVVQVHEPPQKLGRAIALCAYDGHAYFYKSARAVSQWHCSPEGSSGGRSMLKHDVRSSLPPIEAWKHWNGVPAPGHFWASDLVFVCEGSSWSPGDPLKSLCTALRT